MVRCEGDPTGPTVPFENHQRQLRGLADVTRPSLSRRWTPQDDELLTTLLRHRRLSMLAIAIKLRRTPAAISARVNHLKLMSNDNCALSANDQDTNV